RLMARDGLGGGLLLVRLDLVDAIEPGLGAGCVASILLFGVVLVGRVAGLAAHFLAPVLSVAVAVAQDLVRDRRHGAGPTQEGERQQDAEKVLRHARRLQWTDAAPGARLRRAYARVPMVPRPPFDGRPDTNAASRGGCRRRQVMWKVELQMWPVMMARGD